jgi:Mg2+/Co2+ transporter CorB
MWLIIALIILLLLSAFFSSAETALVSLPEYKLKKLLLRKIKMQKH